ncbi:hypothetical protein F5Y17DRAFT_422482 [Xylariaceae sp. FL0594]|nr:hypothetical protein F5Y17DRAFT_422482 [Xylariaceae sp. FL0594]
MPCTVPSLRATKVSFSSWAVSLSLAYQGIAVRAQRSRAHGTLRCNFVCCTCVSTAFSTLDEVQHLLLAPDPGGLGLPVMPAWSTTPSLATWKAITPYHDLRRKRPGRD